MIELLLVLGMLPFELYPLKCISKLLIEKDDSNLPIYIIIKDLKIKYF